MKCEHKNTRPSYLNFCYSDDVIFAACEDCEEILVRFEAPLNEDACPEE
jgi:hypothetical protein